MGKYKLIFPTESQAAEDSMAQFTSARQAPFAWGRESFDCAVQTDANVAGSRPETSVPTSSSC